MGFRISPAVRSGADGDSAAHRRQVLVRAHDLLGDIHQVANAFSDRTSISIHAYGANIGAVARHVFALECGTAKPFVSGYANRMLPNLWDRAAAIRARLGI